MNSRYVPYLIILVVVSIFYSNHWFNDFHFDDSHTIQSNIYIKELKNTPCFYINNAEPCNCKAANTFSSIPSHGSYRPLVSHTLALDYFFGKIYLGLKDENLEEINLSFPKSEQLFFFHLSTFLFFVSQLFLMFLMFKNIFLKYSEERFAKWTALFITLWYGVHPVNAETINYIISRSDSISTFFVVMGIVVYQYSAFCRRFFLYLIPVAVGSLAKPTAVMFLPIILCYHLLFDQEKNLYNFSKWNYNQLFKIFGFCFLICGFLFAGIQYMESGFFQPGGYDRVSYMKTQPAVFLHYFSQMLLPLKLSADADWGLIKSVLSLKFISGFVFLITFISLIFYTSSIPILRPISFGMCWCLLALVPTSVVPLAEVMNDHRMFFPLVGFVLSVGWFLFLILKKWEVENSKLLIPLLSVIVLLYGMGTFQRNKVWLNEETLWKDVTEKSPLNGRGMMNYGLTLMKKGDFEQAEQYFLKSLELIPQYSYLYINLGVLEQQKGNNSSSEKYFKKAIELSSNTPETYFYYGRFLFSTGRNSESSYYLETALQLSDASIFTRELLMDVYFELSASTKLKGLVESTLAIQADNTKAIYYNQILHKGLDKISLMEAELLKNPSAEGWLSLSLLYYYEKRYEDCIAASNKALELRPQYAEAYNNIGSAYNAMNKFKEGSDACKKALSINPNFELAKNNLKWAESNLQ